MQYIPQRAKDNKIQSFPSLPPPDYVASFLSYVSIYIASPASQDAPLASLLVVGNYSQTLWACVEAVGYICPLTQVCGRVFALCPGQSSRWHLRVLHALFQLIPVFHGRGCLCAHGLKILLQPLFWFGNGLPPSMGQFRGVCNRHATTSKTFLYSPKLLTLSHQRCLCTQLGKKIRTQHEGNVEALTGPLMRKWELVIYEG